MVPKVVHYCWFGKGNIPEEYQQHIARWKEILTDHLFIQWDESNFDIDIAKYSEQAYAAQKYAFVSDVARVYALEKMGGIYLDTDVEMIKSPEKLLKDHELILGTENAIEGTIGTGFIAAKPHHPVMQKMLEYYKHTAFVNLDNSFNTLANTTILANILKSTYGIKADHGIVCKQNIMVYPKEYFTAFNNDIIRVEATDDTYCIHHFAGSWSKSKGIKKKIKILTRRFLYIFGLGLKNKKIFKIR